MRQSFVHQSISVRILLISGALFLMVAAVLILLVNRSMRMEALADARITSEVILDRSLATHTYFSHQLKPSLFPITDAAKPKAYFDPVWMSSTYAIREIQKYFQSLGNDAYYYKECAINARSPENEADAVERDFIAKLNAEPSLEFDSHVRKVQDQPFFVVLRRGEAMEASCLRCHSTPDQAPADLVARYGAQRSFGRQADEVVSAISIRIPLARAYAQANRFSLILSAILLALLTALFGLQFWSVRRMVCKPVVAIANHMSAMADGRGPLNVPLAMPPGRELRLLAGAFNTMANRLYDHQRHLEERIQQRTAELENEAILRKQMMAKLTDSEHRYRSLFDYTISGFALHEMVLDGAGHPVDYRFVEVNAAFEQMTGLKKDRLLGQCVTQILPGIEKDPADWIGTYGKVALTGEALRFEQFSAPLNRWFFISAFSHQKGFFATIFIDITPQKKLEADLRESEAKYRSMMESMIDPAYICSPDRRVSYVNPAMAAIVGADTLGQPCFQVIHGLQVPCPDCLLPQIKPGMRLENEAVLERNSRRYHAVHSPLIHSDGTVSKMSIYRDITDKTAMEAQLRQAQKMEAVATLTGGIAHDFNNILGIILGNAELAMQDVPEWNPACYQLEEIRTASLRGRDVVRQLLSFSRKDKEERKLVHLPPLIKESLKLLRATVPANIEIEHHLDAQAPVVLADATQIHQILMNLCTNALHAMEATGGTISVSFEKCEIEVPMPWVFGELKPGSYVRLTVADNGIGISPDNHLRIFDPYYTTKGPDRGSGLGLAVVVGIVKNHDGAIRLLSDIGQGAVFEIYLHAATGLSPPAEVQVEQLPVGSERILVVDDETALATLIEKMLARLGYRVTSRTDPEAALELVRQNPQAFDLVLSDLTMPKMTGDMLAEQLLLIRPDLPMVLCTGNAEAVAGKTEAAQVPGVAAWAAKPIRMRELAVVVRRVLDASSAK